MPIRFAVIGLGMASAPHLQAMGLGGNDFEVSGIYNRSHQRARIVAAEFGYPVFDKLEEIAADKTTDGVILLTPPDQRKQLVKFFSKAGKHILMEKPIERTTRAAEELVEICESRNVLLGIVFQHRFRAGSRRLAEIIRAGEIGDIAVVRVVVPWWRDQSYYDAPGRGTYSRDGGGVLMTQAIHSLDLMLSLVGPVRSVQAFCATTLLHELEAEDFAAGGLRFESGAVGSFMATTATYPGEPEKLVIDGTKGTALLEAGSLKVVWRDGRTQEVGEFSQTGAGSDPMAFSCDWHRDLIADFAAAIGDQRAPIISGREGLKVHFLIDAMIASSRSGHETAVCQPGSES